MKFPITQEQYDELTRIDSEANEIEAEYISITETYNQAMIEYNELTDDIWEEITTEHELDLESHDWQVVLIDGIPYVENKPKE